MISDLLVYFMADSIYKTIRHAKHEFILKFHEEHQNIYTYIFYTMDMAQAAEYHPHCLHNMCAMVDETCKCMIPLLELPQRS